MALDGSVYQRKDGRWVASVDFGISGGKRHRRTRYAATETAAKSLRRKMLTERDKGRIGDDCTVEQWLTHWLDNIAPERASEVTTRNYRSHATRWIIPILGAQRLSALRPEDVRRLRRYIEKTGKVTWKGKPTGKPHSPTTIRAILVTLTAALGAAERERRIAWNPASVVPKPEASREHHAYFTDMAHAVAVIDHALDAEEQARFTVALLAGLRRGEALGLEWRHVDLDRGVIHVRQAAYQVKGEGMAVKPKLKNDWSERDVPMHAAVKTALANHRAAGAGPFVFGGDTPTAGDKDSARWARACKRAGVPVIPLHGARATTATMLREAGVPLSTIGEILGHKPGSPITGLSYAHAQDAELRAAIGMLDA